MLAQVRAHIERRRTGAANNAGYVYWRSTMLFVPTKPYGATGISQTNHWAFAVPPGEVLIVGAYAATVNGQDVGGPGAYLAYRAGTVVDTTVTDGFYVFAAEAEAQAEFCRRVAQAQVNGWAHEVVMGLPAWGPPPC